MGSQYDTNTNANTNTNPPTLPTAMSSPPREKPRLTDQEKKSNHIASEQKRRQAIREGFDRLANLVPGMAGQGRSESLVLQASIDEIRKNIELHKKLVAEGQARGIDVSDLEIPDLDPSVTS